MNGGEQFWKTVNAVLDVLDMAGISPVDALTWLTTFCDELGDRPVDRIGDVFEVLAAARTAADAGWRPL